MKKRLTYSKVIEHLEECSNIFLTFDALFHITFKLIPESGTIPEHEIIKWLKDNTALSQPWEIQAAFVAILASGYLSSYNSEGTNKIFLTTKGRTAKRAISSETSGKMET